MTWAEFLNDEAPRCKCGEPMVLDVDGIWVCLIEHGERELLRQRHGRESQ